MFFFLCRFLRSLFLRLCVAILCRFLFLPQGIFFISWIFVLYVFPIDARPQFL